MRVFLFELFYFASHTSFLQLEARYT